MRYLLAVLFVGFATTLTYGQNTSKNGGGSRQPPTPGGAPSGKTQTAPAPLAPTVKSTQKSSTTKAIEGVDFVDSSIGDTGPFVWIPPGTFQMGSPSSESGRSEDETEHTVALSRGFWILDHEVTQGEYLKVMRLDPSSTQATGWQKGPNYPVNRVSWKDAVAFCEKLTALDRGARTIRENQAYRLPTEAEWEYACRAGTQGAIYYRLADQDSALDYIAWWAENSKDPGDPRDSFWSAKLREVKKKKANPWGLYDMLGNVSEWCSDFYDDYGKGTKALPLNDPKGPSDGFLYVYRGGSFAGDRPRLRAASRRQAIDSLKEVTLGFRPVLGQKP